MMKNYRFLIIALIGLTLFACSGDKSSSGSSLEQTTVKIIKDFSKGEFDKVVTRFDSTMTANVTEEQLKQIWSSLTTQCGAFIKLGETKPVSIDSFEVVFIELKFAKLPYWGKIIFDKESRVAGLRFVAELPTPDPIIADYVDLDSFTEKGGRFGVAEWSLPAIISVPVGTGPFPAVILVHRQGPNDKNESIASNNPFMDIAQGLASQGIAVLRYDNRSFTYKDKFESLETVTVQLEVIRDIHNAVALLKASPEIDRSEIYMLGHGFGGQLAPKVAEQTDSIAGYILMGAPTRPIQQVIVDEVDYVVSEDGSISSSEQMTLDRLRAEAQMVTSPDLTEAVPGEYLPLGRPGSYWLDLRKYKPLEKALEMTEPMLILQGERDYHATMADYADWQQLLLARNNVKLKSFQKLNHLFMTGEGRSNPQEFLKHGNVDREVIDYIAKWIKSQK